MITKRRKNVLEKSRRLQNSSNPNTFDFNPFNDPETFRQYIFQMQQQYPHLNFQPPQLQPNQAFQFQQQQPIPNFPLGFGSFTQGGFQQSETQTRQEMDFVSQTHPERDVVAETQEAPLKRKKKGKKVKATEAAGTSSGPMAPKTWLPEEETALGKCFVDHSEKRILGNSQKRDNLWIKITNSWHVMMGRTDTDYRSHHQLNSKWKDLNTKLTKFNDIYNNCVNQRRSGMSDTDVLKWAEKEYQLKSNGQTFNHYHVWTAIKDSPKWVTICLEASQGHSSSKRTKTSEANAYSPGLSDAHTNYAVNLEEDEDDDPEIREPIRPVGRDTSKRYVFEMSNRHCSPF